MTKKYTVYYEMVCTQQASVEIAANDPGEAEKLFRESWNTDKGQTNLILQAAGNYTGEPTLRVMYTEEE